MAIDVLTRKEHSIFPHPAYAFGFAKQWIFSEPFDTRPIDFSADGQWGVADVDSNAKEAFEFLSTLLKEAKNADRTGT